MDAVVDYRAESRTGAHVVDVAARSEAGGVLHVELTVCDDAGDVVGEGALRLPPSLLPPAERMLGQVLRGLAHLHALPAVPPTRAAQEARRGRPNAGRPWSDEEEERLRTAWAGGTPAAEIAAAHGRSTNAVRSRLLKLGLISLDHPDSPAGRPSQQAGA
ncbi:MAG TPA: hypothetical protein VEL73_08445 [Mycobacteriales bacterium]|nr:hypothetical protein [Mycobacteriales bacterium]